MNDQSTVPLASVFFKYSKAGRGTGFVPRLRQVRGVKHFVTVSRGFLEHFDQHIWQRHGAGFTCLRLLVFEADHTGVKIDLLPFDAACFAKEIA